jgi:hypothetical protein
MGSLWGREKLLTLTNNNKNHDLLVVETALLVGLWVLIGLGQFDHIKQMIKLSLTTLSAFHFGT